MTKRRRIIIFVGALIALIALIGTYLYVRQHTGTSDHETKKEFIIPFTADKIQSIRIVKDDKTELEFTRQDGTWKCTSDPDIELDQTEAGTLVASVTGVTITQTIPNVTDPSIYGLGENKLLLAVTSSEGENVTLEIGDTNETTIDVYCRKTDDETTVYAVSTALLTNLDRDLSEYEIKKETNS